MKVLLTSLCLLVSMAFVSCDENARLAKEIQGSWTGTPENFSDNSSVTSTILETYDFITNLDGTGRQEKSGEVLIEGMITMSTQIVAEGDFNEPLSLTATAKSSIKGTWIVADGDEIALTLDSESLTVDSDPDAIVVEGNILGAENSPKIDTIRPSVAKAMAENVKRALTTRYAGIRHLDDVKVNGPLMKFEIGKKDYVFTRQGASE